MNENYDDKEARELINLLFEGYAKLKSEKRLYKNETVAKTIIRIYYSFVKKANFADLVSSFKIQYLFNENLMERVHSMHEKVGLAKVYDYVDTKNDFENISIYDLSYIHEYLYSLTNFPEFGGKYRREDVYLIGRDETGLVTGNVELTPYYLITHEMNALGPEVERLVKWGMKIKEHINSEELIEYINACIKLNCDLIKIHPFKDGNGRSVRAFTNLLFKITNLPPVYICDQEKIKYQLAMNKALTEGDYTLINTFYYFKICDSIVDLDLNVLREQKDNNGSLRVN